jgi:outer membrane protein assembly factor BamB
MSTHLVSAIDVSDFGSETIRIGDLNGDGAPDLLFVQNVYGTRAITCLTATTIAGTVLWQHGTPSRDNGFVYCDLPVQIYDWDNDGVNEVLYVQQACYAELHADTGYAVERALRYEGDAWLIVLDGLTGLEKSRMPLPAPADDCFLFADLTGRGRREDLVVKDRYWNMWGVAHDGRVLWQWRGETGHCPAIGDVDGDGRDEVFVGFALIDHDGRELWRHDDGGHHQDAAAMVRLADGGWRLLFGNGGVHCLAADGTLLWHHPLDEAQHVVPGRFRLDSELQVMVVNRGQQRGDPNSHGTLYLYDLDGRELWRREQPAGSWCAAGVRVGWFGPGAPDALLIYHRGLVTCEWHGTEMAYRYESGAGEAIYDGDGNLVDTLTMHYPTEPTEDILHCGYYALAADLWGDSRDEVILFGARGACIQANARPLAIPTLYNETLYPGV